MDERREELRRIRRLEDELDAVRRRVSALEGAELSAPPAPMSRVAPPPPPPRAPLRIDPGEARKAVRRAAERTPKISVEDLIGGRVLPWAGAIAVLLGVAFFVAIAIGRGWLGESARIALAYGGSAVLLAAGAWLYEHRGRTQAALAMVGTATASAFLTTAAAVQLYGLFPPAEGLVVAFGVGAVATSLAIRWDSRTVAGLGILGALASPLLLAAGASDAGIAFVAVALACSTAVLLVRRWDWLSLAVFAISAPQLLGWAVSEDSPVELVAVIAVFWALYMVAALGHDLRVARPSVQPVPAVLSLAAPLVTAAGGYAALALAGHPMAGSWLIAGLGAAHVVLAIAARRSDRLSDQIARLLLGGGVALGNTAWGLLADGPYVAVGWAVSAVALGLLARHGKLDRELVAPVLGAQLFLSTLHVLLFEAAPGATFQQMSTGDGTGALVALAALASASFLCARLTRRERVVRVAFDITAMAALAWAEAFALDGPMLTAAWSAQAVALARVAAVERDGVARLGSLCYLGLAISHVVAVEAHPSALGAGADTLAAVLGLASLAGGLAACARLMPAGSEDRGVVGGLAAVTLAYLAPFVLGGPGLVVAWAAGAVGLAAGARVLRGLDADVARGCAAAALVLAGLHVLAFEAPPRALVDGVPGLAAAALAVTALAAALLAAAHLTQRGAERLALEAAGATAALHAVSVVIVSSFGPDASGFDPAVTGLGVRQQGQMLLSAFWAGAGLIALVWGLLRDERSRRVGGLALLSLALAKVFLYDLAALESIYRVVSFVALGVLLLVAAFAYQRIRPSVTAH